MSGDRPTATEVCAQLSCSRCWFFHRWTRWQMVNENWVMKDNPGVTYTREAQRRECIRCGRMERRNLDDAY